MIKTKRDFKIGSSLYQMGKKGVWYCRFKIKGREIRRGTGKLDVKLARDVAWQIFLEESGVTPEKQIPLLRSTYLSIKELLKIYEEQMPARGGPASSSARGNTFCLKRMLEVVYNDFEAEGRLDRITAALVHEWRAKRYNNAGLELGKDSNLRLNYSLNSEFRQAKSIFSRRACEFYAEKGIKLPPSIRAFKDVPFLSAMNTRFTPIPQAVDEAIKHAAANALVADMGKSGELSAPAAVAIELARFCGLTAKEIKAACWSWFVEQSGNVVRLEVRYREQEGFVTKRNKKEGVIAVDPARFQRWKTAIVVKDQDAFFADGEDVLREARAWLAKQLPDREKRLHELRKMAGSDILTKTGSMATTAKFLRDDPSTVERYYATDLSELPAL